jgi:hypothetical protein
VRRARTTARHRDLAGPHGRGTGTASCRFPSVEGDWHGIVNYETGQADELGWSPDRRSGR